VAVLPETLTTLTGQIGATVVRREPVRVWSMSGVERLHLQDGTTAILKYAVERFAGEAAVLAHAAGHGVPVPRLLASTVQADGSGAMLLEDLGEPVKEADLQDAAAAAVAIHACPPLKG
jgi:aminoglycoside phosphotransferase